MDLDEYDRRWMGMVARGESVHGELDFVEDIVLGGRVDGSEPDDAALDILDAGCGTGRLAIEAARRGHRAVGVDLDRDMIDRARSKAPEIPWHHADVSRLDLSIDFDVIVMAGNIPLFCALGTQGSIVAALARHLRPNGWLFCGFSIEKRPDSYRATDFVADAEAAGLRLHAVHPAWDAAVHPIDHRDQFDRGDYAVIVCRNPA